VQAIQTEEKRMRAAMSRGQRWLVFLVAGGGMLLLEGCDASVRDTLLTGFGNAATTLIGTLFQALIQQLQANDDTLNDATTVRALLDLVPRFLA